MSRRGYHRECNLRAFRRLWAETGSLYEPNWDEFEGEILNEESGLDPDANVSPAGMLVSSQYGAYATNLPGDMRRLRR